MLVCIAIDWLWGRSDTKSIQDQKALSEGKNEKYFFYCDCISGSQFQHSSVPWSRNAIKYPNIIFATHFEGAMWVEGWCSKLACLMIAACVESFSVILLTEIERAASNTGNASPSLNDDKASLRDNRSRAYTEISSLVHHLYIAFIFSEEIERRKKKKRVSFPNIYKRGLSWPLYLLGIFEMLRDSPTPRYY